MHVDWDETMPNARNLLLLTLGVFTHERKLEGEISDWRLMIEESISRQL
jgi:hypothetical protein